MSMMMSYLRDERGAEMVEWIVVVAVLAVVAGTIFGPTGVLNDALNTGIQKISNTITSAGS
jgi:Flp pilus assembly pilin Flp